MAREFSIYENPWATMFTNRERYSHLWFGSVVRVNQLDETVDIQWMTYPQANPAVKVSYAACGPRSFIGGDPEPGSIAVCAWMPYLASGNYTPVVLGFIGRGSSMARKFLRTYETDVHNVRYKTRYARPPMMQGDRALVSSGQSGVLASEDLHLFSGGLGEMLYRSADTALLSRFLQEYRYFAGGRELSGMVERYGSSAPVMETQDGRALQYVTQSGASLINSGEAWVERREEIDEVSSGDIPKVDGDLGYHKTSWLPGAVRVLGTLVGNDPSDPSQYGKPLVRDVCSGDTIAASYTAQTVGLGKSSVSYFHMSFPKLDTATVDIDKYGRAAVLLKGNPDKNNRALELGIEGRADIVLTDEFNLSGTALTFLASKGIEVFVSEDAYLSATKVQVEAEQIFLGSGTASSGRGSSPT